MRGYGDRHNLPGEAGTSRLSPHLHFGEISPRRVLYDIRRSDAIAGGPQNNPYLRQLVWREFSYYLLFHFPDSAHAPLRKPFESFPWRDDTDGLEAWKNGRTGYPLVDAGMRELIATGWMHNRVRMVAASFLVKHLMIHWLEGAKWFMETLVDADLANNTMGWQWTAGSGADAAPYFRVFNPSLQGTRFDGDGKYVREWVPELAALPDRYIHSPWKAPVDVLAKAQVKIGRDYPARVVDHDFARMRALTAYDSLSKNNS
jgi:deoxyribodipyrimidine photo-lyase